MGKKKKQEKEKKSKEKEKKLLKTGRKTEDKKESKAEKAPKVEKKRKAEKAPEAEKERKAEKVPEAEKEPKVEKIPEAVKQQKAEKVPEAVKERKAEKMPEEESQRKKVSEVAPKNLAGTAAVFRALGDESRLQILNLLAQKELCAGELLSSLSIVQSTLSHHMKILTESGIVKCKRVGKRSCYSIDKEALEKIHACIRWG